jgi:ribosomal protein S1
MDVDDPASKYNEGDEIKATLLSIDVEDRKLSLSMKNLSKEERANLAKKQAATAAPTLGDLMANKLKK